MMEEIFKLFKAFTSLFTSNVFLTFSSSSQTNQPQLPQPTPTPTATPALGLPPLVQLEVTIQDEPLPIDPTTSNYSNSSSSNMNDHYKLQELLGKMIIEFCFTTAIALLVLSYQNQNDAHFLSISFHILHLSILLAFSTSWGGILLRLRYPSSAKVLEQMGIMFAAAAFFLAMEISVPPNLKWITWLISASSLFFLFIHYMYNGYPYP